MDKRMYIKTNLLKVGCPILVCCSLHQRILLFSLVGIVCDAVSPVSFEIFKF